MAGPLMQQRFDPAFRMMLIDGLKGFERYEPVRDPAVVLKRAAVCITLTDAEAGAGAGADADAGAGAGAGAGEDASACRASVGGVDRPACRTITKCRCASRNGTCSASISTSQ